MNQPLTPYLLTILIIYNIHLILLLPLIVCSIISCKKRKQPMSLFIWSFLFGTVNLFILATIDFIRRLFELVGLFFSQPIDPCIFQIHLENVRNPIMFLYAASMVYFAFFVLSFFIHRIRSASKKTVN